MEGQVNQCVACRHHRLATEQEFVKGMSRHRCTHPAAQPLVSGDESCCYGARGPGAACGPAGKLFVQHVGDLVQRRADSLQPEAR